MADDSLTRLESRVRILQWQVAILAALVVALGLRLAFTTKAPAVASPSDAADDQSNSSASEPAPAAATAPIGEAPDVTRRRAWERIQPWLAESDQAARAQIDLAVAEINSFFRERQKGVRPFAEVILSLKGKWAYLHSKLPRVADDEHFRYLDEKFAENVFRPAELKHEIESAITNYALSVGGIENRLLVRIQADLSEEDSAAGALVPSARDRDSFAAEFRRMLEQVVGQVSHELQLDVTREVVLFVASDLAAGVTLRLGQAVAARVGVQAGILAVGAASSWATLGVGLAAAIVLDIAVDWLIKLAGHDPVTDIASKVNGTVEQVRTLLVEGDPEAVEVYEKLRQLAADDPDQKVRTASADAAASILASGNLGLRRELWRMHAERSELRNAALQRMILGEPPPVEETRPIVAKQPTAK